VEIQPRADSWVVEKALESPIAPGTERNCNANEGASRLLLVHAILKIYSLLPTSFLHYFRMIFLMTTVTFSRICGDKIPPRLRQIITYLEDARLR
jgi:hypothetical protein